MPPCESHRVTDAGTPGSRMKGLYRVGGAAALVSAAMTVAGIVTYLAWPPPEDGSVTTWFTLFQQNWLVGMLDLDLTMLVSYVALIPVLLALYVALRRASESLAVLALVFGLVSIATYFASSRVFEMLALSGQYAAATTDAERAIVAAAGQSMLTTYLGAYAAPAAAPGWNYQGTAFNVSFVLWTVAGIMISAAMLRSGALGKAAGYLGIAGNAGALGLFIPAIGVLLSLLSLPLLLAWLIMIALGLFRLAHSTGEAADLAGAV